MIRAVIFDIGGVLVRTEDLEPRRKWERRFGLPDWGLAQLIFDSPAAQEATLGRADESAIWEHAARALGLSADELAQLQRDFWAGDRYDEALIDYLRSLRPRYKTGIISNAWPGARAFHQHRLNGETFDVLVFSAEEGVAKPAPEIYRRALTRLGVAATQAVFVDDATENVAAACTLGMVGVHFRRGMSAAEVRAALEALDVK
ncbi:MAG: HAD family phosphatase [Anaerolineales bacterium]|nr:HAD family phosphatase [Anaerolineales bacterium]